MDIQNQIVTRILDTRTKFEVADDYYNGHRAEWFFSDQYAALFRNHELGTTLNYMRPIVDNVCNRLEIANVVSTSKQANAVLEKVRNSNQIKMIEKEAHRMVSSLGEAYVLVWVDPDTKEPTIAVKDPRDAVVVYDPDNPTKRLFGAWMHWDEFTNSHKLTIAYPDKIYKFTTKTNDKRVDRLEDMKITSGQQWFETDSFDNPFGEIPLFHLRTHGTSGRPEHYDGYRIQDKINKLNTTHMVTVDYQGAPQRYALAHPGASTEDGPPDFEQGDTAADDTGLQNKPGGLWFMSNIQSVGQFDPAKPQIFTDPIDHMVQALASLTNTPLQYFQSKTLYSGNAWRSSEAPLLNKVSDRQVAYTPVWQQIYSFVIRIELEKTNSEIIIHWKTVESLDELEKWDVMAKKRNVGMPFRQVMIEAGYDETKIKEMIKWREEDAAKVGNEYSRAANTNPEVRTNISSDETNPAPIEGVN